MRKLTLEEIQDEACRRGGRCLNDTYLGSLALMDWQCAEAHRWRATPHSIRQGHWCKKCADQRLRIPAARVADIAAARGGRCLGPYTNTATKMGWACARGHEWYSSLNAVKDGAWCPTCTGRRVKRTARPTQAWIGAIRRAPELQAAEALKPSNQE
jgi:hypothetical protein